MVIACSAILWTELVADAGLLVVVGIGWSILVEVGCRSALGVSGCIMWPPALVSGYAEVLVVDAVEWLTADPG